MTQKKDDLTQSEARAKEKEGMGPSERELDKQGKTSRTQDEIRQQVEETRDHGYPGQTQQVPVSPAPISQEELERLEQEKRERNEELQQPAETVKPGEYPEGTVPLEEVPHGKAP